MPKASPTKPKAAKAIAAMTKGSAKAKANKAAEAAVGRRTRSQTRRAKADAKKKPRAEAVVPVDQPRSVAFVPDRGLSFEEQEALTDALHELPESRLGAVFNIIRTHTGDVDADEIDVDIADLSIECQRALQSFVAEAEHDGEGDVVSRDEGATLLEMLNNLQQSTQALYAQMLAR